MSRFAFVFILLISVGHHVQAQTSVVNEVLFELNQEVWTSYDYKQFLKAKNKISLNVPFLKQAQNDVELFLLTRILFYQMTASMTTFEAAQYSLLTKYRDQNDTYNVELQRLKMIVESDENRFQQLAIKDKYVLWLNYMKKKYNYLSQ